MIPILISVALAAAVTAGTRFTATASGFEFNTGVLAGALRLEGKSVGLLPVTYVPGELLLTHSMGLAGHYRVFSGNHRYGNGAWYWPSTAALRDDGSVEAHWAAGPDRPFDMWAVYRWAGPSTLDVDTRVRPTADLEDFELFMAWYFSEPFDTSLASAGGGFLRATPDAGAWQMFPRDDDAARMIQDGRWKAPPSPVNWTIRPRFDYPIAVRRAEKNGLAVVVMAPREDCFAVAMPQESDSHRSLYLSLFGRTLHQGETAHVRTRTVVLPEATDARILALYQEYVRK